jgi:hypothetical protein
MIQPDATRERRCRQRIEEAIGDDTGTFEVLGALATALTDEAMTMVKEDGDHMDEEEIKTFLAELLNDVVDVCFAQDQANNGTNTE